jgi:hypothetical protein
MTGLALLDTLKQRAEASMTMRINPPPTPSVVPPKPYSLQGKADTTNSQPPLVLFCAETPISQPTTPHPEPISAPLGKGQAGMTLRAKGNPPPKRALLQLTSY